MRPERPANDNRQKLPNNGWWIVPVFWVALLIVLALTLYRVGAG